MSKEEFSDYKDNEGWEEEGDEEEEAKISHAFSNDGLPELKDQWKRLIHEAARQTASSYGDGADGDQALMEDKVARAGLSSRQLNALQVRYGQKSILYRLMELTKS